MKKITFQALIIAAIFFSSWYILSRVNWVTIFNVEEITDNTEEILGDLYWDMISQSEDVIINKDITLPVNLILDRICLSNNIDPDEIKLHIIKNSELNAFALPDKHLVIYSNLILSADDESELAGVISHELAHIQLGHIMKKLIKEIGLAVILTMTTGNNNGQVIQESARILSSSAFDRVLEKEADIKSVDYLKNAQVNPEGLANFLFKISREESTLERQLSWISTHPNTPDRVKYIINYCRNSSYDSEDILTKDSWKNLQASIKDYNNY